MKPQYLPLISQIIADKPQNYINQTVFLCDIMQPRCIRLRDLRYLRENIHIRVLNQSPKKPQCLPQISQMTQTNPKTTLTPNSLSLRNNAACCIPLRDLRNLRENIHIRVLKQSPKKEPQCLPQISQIYADETQNHTNYKLSFSAE